MAEDNFWVLSFCTFALYFVALKRFVVAQKIVFLENVCIATRCLTRKFLLKADSYP